jgi:hypothetical protein
MSSAGKNQGRRGTLTTGKRLCYKRLEKEEAACA